MANDFKAFATSVRARFDEMSTNSLFSVAIDNDAIWAAYLAAFPAGSDPIYRENTEHFCSCCRHFIRAIGNVVAIQNGAVSTIWDLNGLPYPYQDVADAMAAHVKSLPIRDVFLAMEPKYGVAENSALINGTLFKFNHFAVSVPRQFVTKDAVEKRGYARTTHAVFMRGLTELTPEAVATVSDLIASNAIYRGQEHERAVLEFQHVQSLFLSGDAANRDLIAWTLIASPVARFRNTAIGTLVQDLSDGVEIERAVKSFETKVAPQNYKRTTALITKPMIDAAMKTIADLDLEQAMERRHAQFSDVSVNSVLFVDRAVKPQMKGGKLENLLMEEVKPRPFDPKKSEEIGVAAFMADVLPKVTGLQVFVDNSMMGKFMSLTAPVYESSGRLLRWSNDFAWSYDGNVADSIKDRVKAAGGQVENVAMRVSLSWINFDDLDLHVIEPDGTHIYFSTKQSRNSGGTLDVDMNAGGGMTREPVENIRWTRKPPNGTYQVYVNNFAKRESVDVGFVVELESPHGMDTFRFDKAVPGRANQPVCAITVKNGVIFTIDVAPGIVAGHASREQWGLKTLELAKVNSLVLSPNYWDDNAVGNKHWFFILEGCKNPLPMRGFYNEFLHPSLEKHRKVFEILGDKTKCPVVDAQMSGVGFSSTRKDKVTVVATGQNLNKVYTIVF